jgi:3-hydroxyacyl-CoA dehydrogenase
MDKIALIGAGAIGRAWAIVFARAGYRVALQSRTEHTLAEAGNIIDARLRDLHEFELLDEDVAVIRSRIDPLVQLERAVADAVYVQENICENVAEKRVLYAQLDELARPDVILASSTSTLPASQFAAHLRHRERCLVAHPVNPPYLIPAVEICPGPFTSADAVTRTARLLSSVGQSPIVMKKEIAGFVMNRLQSLVACEAMRLVEDNYVEPEDLDLAMKDGLGLRWAFMGPLETLDLNAAGGFAAFAQVFAPIMHAIDASTEATPREWSRAVIGRIDQSRRADAPLSQHSERIAWRDRRLMALIAHKRAMSERESDGNAISS